MISVEHALSEFIDAWNAGRRPRVSEYLERVAEADRRTLAGELEDWLAVAPTPRYDRAARAAIRAERAFDQALSAVEGQAGLWPELLPRLRHDAGLGLRELAGRITVAFGLKGDEDRAERYLQRMEQGRLDASRVSRRLLDTLGRALGVPAGDLVAAGLARPAPATASGALFRAERDAAAGFEDELEALSLAALAPAPPEMDELERLFLGGPEA
jgi:transcriptional regulator with XRE-family HTH domain